MSDSAKGTVSPERLPDFHPLAAVDSIGQTPTGGGLHVGQRWHDLVIQSEWPGCPRTYVAEQSGTLKKLLVRAFPVVASTEWRRGAWDRLCALPNLQTVRCLSAEEESGWRYEISAVPPPMMLKEWLALHRPGFEEIQSLVRQLAATLGALHAQGVVHLNICPATIYIDDSGAEPVYILGGLHEATLYTQPDLTSADVNPLYAPPEAAEQLGRLAGTRLCAWDWWSTGRVVQEFVLGRHVLGFILDRDVSVPTPELRAKAEQLLLEREPAGVRAGALDYMTLEPALAPLLRGLLTGSCEGRWGLDAVQRWLRREPVLDHYDLPRHARFWVYKGRGFTLGEAADFFTRAENWDTGEEMLFHPERADTLAAFLQSSPGHKEDLERLTAICDLSESEAWRQVPVVARRLVTAALAWLSLANGSGVRTAVRIRGCGVDVLGLAELLRATAPGDSVAIFTALLTPSVVSFIEQFDAPAVRMLNNLATKGAGAIRHGAENGWLDLHDIEAQARIFELALKAGALLRDRLDLMRSLYATSSNSALAALLAEKTPTPRDVVILAFTSEKPEQFGYITHDEWRRQRLAALTGQARNVVTALFWIRLHQLLASTRIWGAPTPLFSGGVLIITMAALWFGREVAPAAEISTLLLLSRTYFWWRVRSMVQKFDPAASPWLWSDGLLRSGKEVEQVRTRSKMSSAELVSELARLRAATAEYSPADKHAPSLAQPRWWDLGAVLGGAVAATLVIAATLILEHHPVLTLTRKSQVTPGTSIHTSSPKVAEPGASDAALRNLIPSVDADALVASGKYELIDDGFGRQLRGPLKPWPYYAKGPAKPLKVVAQAPASGEQSAFALVSGTVLLQPYRRHGLSVFLAVRVPTTRGFGFLIFNSRDRGLQDHEVRLVSEPLEPETMYQLGARRLLYLGTPAGLEAEISLAPP